MSSTASSSGRANSPRHCSSGRTRLHSARRDSSVMATAPSTAVRTPRRAPPRARRRRHRARPQRRSPSDPRRPTSSAGDDRAAPGRVRRPTSRHGMPIRSNSALPALVRATLLSRNPRQPSPAHVGPGVGGAGPGADDRVGRERPAASTALPRSTPPTGARRRSRGAPPGDQPTEMWAWTYPSYGNLSGRSWNSTSTMVRWVVTRRNPRILCRRGDLNPHEH